MSAYGWERSGSKGDERACKLWRHEDLIDFVDGDLAEASAREIEHHLAACDTCRTYVDSLRRTLAKAVHDPVPEPPEAYWACFDQVVRHRTPGRRAYPRRRWLATRLAPCLAAVAVAVGFAVRYLSPSSGDRRSGPALQPWNAIEIGGTAAVDSLVVALLAEVQDDAMASLDEYLAEDDDVVAIADGLPRSAKQSLVSRLSGLMKLKG